MLYSFKISWGTEMRSCYYFIHIHSPSVPLITPTQTIQSHTYKHARHAKQVLLSKNNHKRGLFSLAAFWNQEMPLLSRHNYPGWLILLLEHNVLPFTSKNEQLRISIYSIVNTSMKTHRSDKYIVRLKREASLTRGYVFWGYVFSWLAYPAVMLLWNIIYIGYSHVVPRNALHLEPLGKFNLVWAKWE